MEACNCSYRSPNPTCVPGTSKKAQTPIPIGFFHRALCWALRSSTRAWARCFPMREHPQPGCCDRPWAKRHTLSPKTKRRVLSTALASLVCSGPVPPPSVATAPAWLGGQAEPQHTSTHSTSHCVGEVFIPVQTQPGQGVCSFLCPIPRRSPSSHRLCTCILASHVLRLWVSTKQEIHFLWEILFDLN